MATEEQQAHAGERPGRAQKVGKYVITKELGRGSTGTVYLCHDPYHGTDVALKLYHPDTDLSDDQKAVRRRLFFNEAQLAGRLEHPNILPVFDAGEDEGARYVVMEYIRGARPLSSYCGPHHTLSVRKIVEIGFKCAKALDYAHREGVIHRDIKPSNILFTPDEDIRLVDFGIAETALSGPGPGKGLIGSPSYMAPELMKKRPATKQTDLYGLGVVMYELLTGKRPFYGDRLERLVRQIVYATPPPIHRLRSEVPQLLEEIVAKALEKKPGRRYRTGAEFAADLTRAFTHLERMDAQMAAQERFNLLRHLTFFEDFTYPEIWEVLHASHWQSYGDDEEIIREGQIDDSFFIVVSGEVELNKSGEAVGVFGPGGCFGETGYLDKARRTATAVARGPVQVLRVNTTLIEQASTETQLRFNRVFLKTLLERLSSRGG